MGQLVSQESIASVSSSVANESRRVVATDWHRYRPFQMKETLYRYTHMPLGIFQHSIFNRWS